MLGPSPMKVVHVMCSAVPEYGGPFTALVGYVEASAAAGIETEVFSTDSWGTSGGGLVPGGVRYTRSVFRRHYPISFELRRALRDGVRDADVVHIHGLWRFHTLAGALAARSRGIPYILRTCGHLSPESFAYSSLQKRIYYRMVDGHLVQGAARLHFTTEHERDASRWIAGDVPHEILPPPVSAVERVDRPEARRRLGIDAGASLLVTVGRLNPIKKHDALIEALAHLPPTVQLVIVGADEREHGSVLERRAAQAGVADRVRFTGHADRQALGAWLAAADLFVSLSEHENFGIAIAEAAIAGVPLLIPGDLPIARTFHGLEVILDSREPGAVAAAVAERLASEGRWEQARRSRDAARGLWSREAIGARLRALYEGVCTLAA